MKKTLLVGDKVIAAAVKQGLTFIKASQQNDGSFNGQAGAYSLGSTFKPTHASPTVFFTSLTLECLSNVAGAAIVRRRAAHFLLEQRSSNWRWNYWIRESKLARTHPYPDDLDDFACALAALTSYDKNLIDGTILGHIAQTLIEAETTPGGPYRTWLTTHPDWQKVDIAVNANIGYMLQKHTVSVPGLNSYISQAIASNTLESDFYVGNLPVLYFISRWYKETHYAELKQRLIDEIDTVDRNNALSLALLITSCCNVHAPVEFLYPLVRQLIVLQSYGHYAAEALYRDPHTDGVDLYAGSATLTTAFAVEALHSYQKYISKKDTPLLQKQHSGATAIVSSSNQLPLLNKNYRAYRDKFLRYNDIPEITSIATVTAQATGKKVSKKILTHLNNASLSGWIAYSIYDDFLDGAGAPHLLSVANRAARTMQQEFAVALPDKSFAELVRKTLDTIDEANTWESTYARAPQIHGKTTITQLPRYEDNALLAHKSLGHMLASCGVLIELGYSAQSKEMTAFQRYFFHFLIARQLNDDAHDWVEDLQSGRITPIICYLLNDQKLPFTATQSSIIKLRQKFWRQTIPHVHEQICYHVEQGRAALTLCGYLKSPDAFGKWLTNLETASTKALTGSREAQKFIKTFSAKKAHE